MRAVCQRVSEARVRVGGDIVGEIGPGLCILLGIARGDAETAPLAGKIARLRIFPDDTGRFDRSLLDTAGAALVVSQFTLLADTGKGNRPSFTEAAPPDEAEPLYERFCADLEALGVPVARGVFGASMAVELVNDGPVTIVLCARHVKLLVTGAAGYLGSEVCRLAQERGDEVLAGALARTPPYGQAVRLDVRDAEAVERILMRHGPEAVVHTAYVQSGPALGDTVVRGSRAIAAAAHRSGARLVHLSTDLVFDGEQGAPYREDAEPRPVGDYGAAKLEAERLVLQAHPGGLLVRTSLLYGKPGPQEALALRDGVELYTDEIRCPIRVDELAAALLELAETDLAGPLHVAGPDAVSRYEFGRLLRAATGLDPDGVRGAPSPRDGRARNVALDSSQAAGILRIRLTGIGRSA